MGRSGPASLPPESSSRFRRLLDPMREAVGTASTVEEIHDALAELRRVESLAEAQRVRLTLNDLEAVTQSPELDRTLDSVQTAQYLSRSLDWIYHHRRLLRPALVSPEDSRPRYSTGELDRLRRTWKAKKEATR
jgi:hypothetical protein